MKKSLRFISFLLVAAMLFCMIPFAVSATSTLDGKKILFFGDSLTELGGSSRYTDLLANMFPDSTIINKGYRGNSTYEARLRFDADVIAQDPDVVFICFGMNDQAVQSNGLPIKSKERYRANVANFITALQNIDCDVVLMTPSPVCAESYFTRDPNYLSGDLSGYCDILRDLAVEYNCGLVDINNVFTENGYVTSTYIGDGLHQTAKGHKVYADNISAYLNAAYNNVNKATLTINCVTENGENIKSYNRVGAIGANVKILVPQMYGYEALSESVTTTLATKTIEFIYTSPWEEAIAKVDAINPDDYGVNVLAEIEHYRQFCENATDLSEKAFAASKLEYLLTVKGDSELIYSTCLAYTTSPAPNYFYDSGDTRFVDDNVRLSDGSKSNSDGGNVYVNCYSAWQGTNVDVIFDFYREITVDTFRGYFADGQWGISAPEGMKISVSDDGINYTEISATATSQKIVDGDWDNHCLTVNCDAVKARYVKFTIIPVSWGARYLWVDEVEVALADTDAVVTETPEPPETGDLNGNGQIDAFDYVLQKRLYFGTYAIDNSDIADINGNGQLDAFDYVLLKRAYFGTFSIA